MAVDPEGEVQLLYLLALDSEMQWQRLLFLAPMDCSFMRDSDDFTETSLVSFPYLEIERSPRIREFTVNEVLRGFFPYYEEDS